MSPQNIDEWNQFLSMAVAQSSEGIATANIDLKLTYANQAWTDMHGYDSSKEFIGKSINIFHNQDQIENHVKPFVRIVNEKGFHMGEVGHIRKDGTLFHTMMSTTLLKNAEGIPIAILGIARDITERKQVEEALKAEKKRLAESQRIAQIGSFQHNMLTQKVYWSEEMFNLFGLDPEKTSENFDLFFSMLHPDDKTKVKKALGETKDSGKPYNVEYRFIRKDGETRIFHAQGKTLPDSYGNRVVLTGTIQDITERKQIDVALKESHEKFRILFEDAPMPYQSLDCNGLIVKVNDAWLSHLGYTKDEVLHKSFGDFLPGEWKNQFMENFPRFKALGEILGVEFEMLRKDGSKVLMAINGKIGRNPDGSFKQTHCVLHDITERRNTEKELEKYYDQMEKTVNEKTTDLVQKTIRLEELNVTLKVLLQQGEKDKIELEQKILNNVEKLISPYLEKLKTKMSDSIQMTYADIIESNLKEIISPFAFNLSGNQSKLTPAEIQVADLIRQGKPTKEIAGILQLSPTTIATHRQNIRKKLALTNKKMNLRTILTTID